MARAAQRIDPVAVGNAARHAGLPEAHVRAVVHVESNGVAFATVDGLQEPLIRFEGHIFDRQLKGWQQTTARSEGLASPVAQKVKNPKDQTARWRLLRKAMRINQQAAYEATSWGVGQVMGMHWKSLGFPSVEAFVDRARSGLEGQIDIMLRYIRWAGLEDELIAGQWSAFARGYNGPNYRKFSYHTKLADAAELFGGGTASNDNLVRMGAKGPKVREVQALLVRAGFPLKVDGDFGTTTRDKVKEFQTGRSLAADGVVGPETFRALAAYRTDASDAPGKQAVLEVPEVKIGGLIAAGAAISPEVISTAKAGLEAAVTQIVGAGIQSVALDYLVQGLTVGAGVLGAAGAIYALVGFVRSRQTTLA